MNDHDDWVLSKDNKAKTTSSPFNGNDWQLAAPENRRKDNLLESAIMAPIRIAADTLGGAYNAASKIPEYWQKAKTEVPAFHNPINAIKHPLHRAGQALAGALEGAQAINHLPRDIAEYGENRLNLLPKGWAQKVPVAPDITGAIENTFGQPKYPGEALARGAGRNVLNGAALASAINKIPHLTKSGATKKLRQNQVRMDAFKENATKEKIPFEKYDVGNLFGVSRNTSDTVMPTNNLGMIKEGNKARVINSVVGLNDRGKGIGKSLYKEAIEDAHKKGLKFESDSIVSDDALRVYKSLEKEGYKFKYNPNVEKTLMKHEGNNYHGLKSTDGESPVVKLISKPKIKEPGTLNIKPELIEDMRKYMPNDAAFRDLVDAAHSGDYNKLFKLQSSVGQLSAKRSRALFSPEERIKGQAGFQAINALLDDMHKEMKGKGLLKESELLRQGRNDFRRYSKFKKYKYGLGALAAGYAIPKNSLTDLGKKIWSIVGQK
jgi:hypothetical protein